MPLPIRDAGEARVFSSSPVGAVLFPSPPNVAPPILSFAQATSMIYDRLAFSLPSSVFTYLSMVSSQGVVVVSSLAIRDPFRSSSFLPAFRHNPSFSAPHDLLFLSLQTRCF